MKKRHLTSVVVLILGWAALSGGLLLAGSKKRVVITNVSPEHVQKLRKLVPEVELIVPEEDQLLEEVSRADGLVGNCDVSAVQAGTRLQWIQTLSAGVEYCMSPELADSTITLTNAKILQGPEIADHALALLLTLTRGIHLALQKQAQREWYAMEHSRSGVHKPTGLRIIELRGKTALVIGLGGIGTQVAERAFAFGMRVLAVDPKDIPYMRAVERTVKPDALNSVLPEADVVFMCAPHTPRSEGMLGRDQFRRMKRGAYFINVSRGRTVQTEALVEALERGQLSGAGLDVTHPEPLPQSHPLWSMKNVVLTPHIATLSDQGWERRVELVEENLRRFAVGLPLYHVVDKEKGY